MGTQLSHIDGGLVAELRNWKLHHLVTDPSGAITGLFGFHQTRKTMMFTDGARVINLGDLSQVTPPSADVNLNSKKITNLADPVNPQDAATKNYTDLLNQGFSGIADPARVRAQGNANVSSPGASIDGTAMNAGDRILLNAQTTGTENDLWVFNGASVAMTRAAITIDPLNQNDVRDGLLVAVQEGSDAGKLYIQQATPSGNRGAWAQNWTYYGTGQTYSAGTGISIAGNVISLAVPVSLANGGTGAATAAAARANLGAVGKVAQDIGNGSATSFVLNHNLGTLDVSLTLRRNATPRDRVEADWEATDANNVTVKNVLVAPAAAELRAIVMG